MTTAQSQDAHLQPVHAAYPYLDPTDASRGAPAIEVSLLDSVLAMVEDTRNMTCTPTLAEVQCSGHGHAIA